MKCTVFLYAEVEIDHFLVTNVIIMNQSFLTVADPRDPASDRLILSKVCLCNPWRSLENVLPLNFEFKTLLVMIYRSKILSYFLSLIQFTKQVMQTCLASEGFLLPRMYQLLMTTRNLDMEFVQTFVFYSLNKLFLTDKT